MSIALYIIGATALVLLLLVKLRDAHEELARMKGDFDQRAKAEWDAYTLGVSMSLACILAGLAAASWQPPRKEAEK